MSRGSGRPSVLEKIADQNHHLFCRLLRGVVPRLLELALKIQQIDSGSDILLILQMLNSGDHKTTEETGALMQTVYRHK